MTVDSLAPTPASSGMSPQDVVNRISGAAKSSFSLGMRLLSRPRRDAMRAIYAFCRVVDDIADGDLPTDAKRSLLADWRQEISRLYSGAPLSAIGQAMMDPIATYDLPEPEFIMMIEGMEMDANGPIVAPTYSELRAYTRRVAGSVGLLSMRTFGAWRGEVSQEFALALADALQLTNILRDVEEDAAIGRIYLPRELLEKHGVSADVETISNSANLPGVRRDLGALARAEYDKARTMIPSHGRWALAPALAMLGVYEAYLDKMEAQGWVFEAPMSLGKFAKVRHGLGAVFFAAPRP